MPAPEGWPYRVAVVNETFARRYLKGANPVGRHIGIGEDPGTRTPIEIVGLAKDTNYMSLREEHGRRCSCRTCRRATSTM